MTLRPQSLAGVAGTLSLLMILNACANESITMPEKKETLSARLVLRDSQDGFAGTTGILCIIEVNGRYSVARFVNEKIEPPMRTGQLNPDAIFELASSLKKQQIQTLPAQIGDGPAVNPRRLSIQYGNTHTQLSLNPGEDSHKALVGNEQKSNDPSYRFLVVANTVLRLVGQQH